MSDQPLVTIGMPVYNGAKYLAKAIEGLSAQTASNIEIIVSDDASRDASPAILAEWAQADPRVRVERHEQNLGTIGNFEWLVREAKGDYFMWAAQDDSWSPDYVDVLRRTLSDTPDADLAAGGNILLSEDWYKFRRIAAPAARRPSSLFYKQYLLRHARNGWFYGMYRRDVLFYALPLVREFGHAWGHDFITLLPFLLSGRVTGNDAVIYYQRITTNSADTLKPRALAKERQLYRDFTNTALKGLRESQLSAAERTYLTPFVIKYCNRHSVTWKQLIKRHLKLSA
ncbi:MAG: glycosyltransferase family 2 protein [Pseudomonadota bacterium]